MANKPNQLRIAGVARLHKLTRIRRGLNNLPSMPVVLTRLLKLLDDKRSSVDQLTEHFRRDQALAAKMLRLANSPFFGLREPVTTISHAAVVLGYKTMRSLVLGAWVGDFLCREVKPYGYVKGGLWKHCLASALVSRHMARQFKMGPDDAEMLFLGGLLHDVGKLLLAQHTDGPATFVTGKSDETTTILERERNELGTDHASIGADIAKAWRFPPALTGVIQNHHAPSAKLEQARATAVIHLVDWCCNSHLVGLSVSHPTPPPPTAEALRILGVNRSALWSWRERTADTVRQASEMGAQLI